MNQNKRHFLFISPDDFQNKKMTTFSDHFWGGKNNGFYVLYHNMKHGQVSSKEFVDFLRESCTVEENYSKLLTKLAKVATNSTQIGTFAPFWNVLKTLSEKLASLHMQLVHTWTDLIKDVARYNEEQHKRHKTMKETESSTLETVQSIQSTTTALHKAKEIYHTRCLELERLKRDNASQKEIEKAESKYKKAHDDYKVLVEKYANIRNDFETKMLDSCKVHSEFKANCDEYSVQKILELFVNSKKTGTEKPGPLEFVEPDLSSLPPPRPMSPDPGEKRESFSEKRQDSALFTDSSGSPSPVLSDQPGPLSRSVKLRVSRTYSQVLDLGFLKNKKKKEKKKNKKKEDKDKDDKSSDTQSIIQYLCCCHPFQTTPEVDEEGYRIRPDITDNNGDKNSWYSSDSDSDSDDEARRKIKVEIRPLSPNGIGTTTGTVEDIKASVEGLRLSPTAITKRRSQTPIDKKMKRSQSESDTLDNIKPSQDLLNLDIFGSSSASTPTGGGNYLPSPLSPMADTSLQNSIQNSASTTPVTNSDISNLCNSIDNSPASSKTNPLPSPSSQITSPVGGFPVPPKRPPSLSKGITPPVSIVMIYIFISIKNKIDTQYYFKCGRKENLRWKFNICVPARPSGRSSPATFMSRSDSSSSVTFNTTSMPVGSSRGPSPLTIGMSDTIPLAVAFTETVNSYFKGTDATKCMVKISGNLMISFPAGVVKVFTDNPSPAMLSFRIKNSSRLEQVLLNKQLIVQDTDQSSSDVLVYTFNMSALSDHLKSQGESNKSASYFNIDVIKYSVIRCPGEPCFSFDRMSQKLKKSINRFYFIVSTLPGVESTPLPVVVYWKCEEKYTDYRLDYKFNPNSLSSTATLKNIAATVSISGGVSNMQSLPNGNWYDIDFILLILSFIVYRKFNKLFNEERKRSISIWSNIFISEMDEENQRAAWKLDDISEVSENGSQGCIRAKFDLKSGPSIPATTAIQFVCEGALLSGVDFELIGSGYRISLAKKRFGAGINYLL
ncbi:LOW QUALITY PROTEIN: hypothetical protein KUTeg_015830, partial [Tegillarca granosa]